ncbi:MAG: hypothetical protein PHS60_03250 [Zavarzinia sp.]|nr:hypothetical protein [Zavarzinia sp.]
MSGSSTETFARAAKRARTTKRERPAPFSLRLNADERAYLERKAGNRALGAYIRSELLDGHNARRRNVRAPSMDYALLGQVLGALGQSDISKHLCLLAAAAEAGRLHLAADERTALHEACAHVREMRAALVGALGLKSGGAS